MHMADALLAPAVAATMYVASGTAAGVSNRPMNLATTWLPFSTISVFIYV